MTTTLPIARIERRARRRSFVTGLLVGAVLMFGALATVDLHSRAQAAHVIVRGEA